MTQTSTVILQGVVGSTAYGLATPESDQDRLGVFVAPIDNVLGLYGPSVVTTSSQTHEPDLTFHEVGKFLNLCLKGNPTVMELLYVIEHDIAEPPGELLLSVRKAVLSESAVRGAYTGYAVQQARRLQNRLADGKEGFSSTVAKRTAKHARHCVRLLIMGRELLTTGVLSLDVSARRDEIFAAGELAVSDPDAFVAAFEAELASVEEVDSVLPEAPDVETVEAVLVAIRKMCD